MKVTKDTFALICCAFLVLGFLISGIFDVLNYFIVQAILIGTLVGLMLLVFMSSASEKDHQSEEDL